MAQFCLGTWCRLAQNVACKNLRTINQTLAFATQNQKAKKSNHGTKTAKQKTTTQKNGKHDISKLNKSLQKHCKIQKLAKPQIEKHNTLQLAKNSKGEAKMAKSQNQTIKKSKKYGILFAILAFVVIAITGISVTWAYFTAITNTRAQATTPVVGVSLTGGSDTITLGQTSSVSVKNNANCDIYLRAKVITNCYNSSGAIVTNLDASDYFTFTTSGWTNGLSGYDSNFIYYGSTAPTKLAYGSADTITVVNGIIKGQDLPEGITVKMQVFVEAVQADASGLGLAKWQTN